MCGVTLLDKIPSEELKTRMGLEKDIVEAMRESRLRGYGHVISLGMAPIFTCDPISAANFYSDMSQRILCLIWAVINSQTIQTYKKMMQFYTKG